MGDFAPIDLLFVPADRPERFAKALAAASAVCIDLEDAVSPDNKAAARDALRAALRSGNLPPERVVVRIQAEGAPGHDEDLALVAEGGMAAVMLPKAEGPQSVERVAAQLKDTAGVIALVETARGLRRAHDIADAPGVIGLTFGALDLAADLDAVLADQDRDHFRRLLRLASAEAGVACWNSPWPALNDAAGLSSDAKRAADLGYTGMLCIHPAQTSAVRDAFTPSAEAVGRARAIVEAAAGGGAVRLDGAMIDAPVVARARQTLARLGRHSSPQAPEDL